MIVFVRNVERYAAAINEGDIDKEKHRLAILKQLNNEGKIREPQLSLWIKLLVRESTNGFDSQNYIKARRLFWEEFKLFRKQYALHIDNQEMKHLLSMFIYQVRSSERARRIPPEIAVSRKIDKIINDNNPFGRDHMLLSMEIATRSRELLKILLDPDPKLKRTRRLIMCQNILKEIKQLEKSLCEDFGTLNGKFSWLPEEEPLAGWMN